MADRQRTLLCLMYCPKAYFILLHIIEGGHQSLLNSVAFAIFSHCGVFQPDFFFCSPVTADTFLVEGNKQEHQLSNLKPSTTYSVALYATKGPLTSGTVITNLQTRMWSIYPAGLGALRSAVTQWLSLLPRSRMLLQARLEPSKFQIEMFSACCLRGFLHNKK